MEHLRKNDGKESRDGFGESLKRSKKFLRLKPSRQNGASIVGEFDKERTAKCPKLKMGLPEP
jgi:hypothetical protein